MGKMNKETTSLSLLNKNRKFKKKKSETKLTGKVINKNTKQNVC